MGQFDVYRNPGRQAAAIPFLVCLQSDRLARAATRLVAPLAVPAHGVEDHYLTPGFTIAGQSVVLDVFNLATIAANRLGDPVAALGGEADRTRIVRALDELISQA
jgi:toxin CcdB